LRSTSETYKKPKEDALKNDLEKKLIEKWLNKYLKGEVKEVVL